jgi:hypothetical protein
LGAEAAGVTVPSLVAVEARPIAEAYWRVRPSPRGSGADSASAAALPQARDARSGGHHLYVPFASASTTDADVVFDVASSIAEVPFDLRLRATGGEAEIRYSLDASLPGSPGALVFGAPLHIGKTTVIRAAAFEDGRQVSPVRTRTYLFPRDVLGTTDEGAVAAGFPATWGTYTDRRWRGQPVRARYGLEPASVAADAAAINAAMRVLPVLSVVAPIGDVFGDRGI